MKISEIKSLGKKQMQNNWGYSVLVLLVISAISSAGGMIFIGIFLLIGPLMVGQAKYFLRDARHQQPSFETAFAGFKDYGRNMASGLLMYLFVFLWSLLLFIPGIIKSLSYAMTPYILADNPNIGPREAINESRRMMNGNKGKLFKMYLSFIGWILLSILTLGILFILYVSPYMTASLANFYNELKKSEDGNADSSEAVIA